MRLSLAQSMGLALAASTSLASVASAGVNFWYDRQANPDPLAPQACNGSGCWTNYLRVADLDGNDTLDLILVNYGGFFQPGTAQPLVIYDNDGNAGFTNVSDVAVGDYTGRIRQVAIGDVDGDGAPDIYVPSARAEGDAFFINDGMGVFTDEVGDRLPGLNSRAGAARFFDADGDGDLDLLLADGYITNTVVYAHLYINDGDGSFTELGGAFPGNLGGDDIDDVDIFDADRDFDLDVLVNAHAGQNGLWINDGAGMFTDASDDMADTATMGGFHYNPAVCDVDGDGDLDIWVDNMGGGYDEQLLINDGMGVFSDETTARVSGNDGGTDDNGVACADIDNDGDFDAIVYSLGTTERFLSNDGNGNFTEMGGVFPGPVDTTLWGEFGDLDGDGRPDLVTGQGEGAELEQVYLANQAVPVDDRSPEVPDFETPPAMVAADEEVVLRYVVTDRLVTDEGPRLSAAFARITIDGSSQDIPATFMGGDLFRVAIPGQPEGAGVEVELCATDRQGNEGCFAAGTYQVGGASTTGTDSGTSDSDSGSSTSDTGSGTSSGSGSSDSDSGASMTGGSSGVDTEGDTDGDTAGAGDDDSGCSCRTNRQRPADILLLGFVVLGALARRRR